MNEHIRDENLVVHLEHYEGPLHTLLDLVRTKKLDINMVSVLSIVEQFLLALRQGIPLYLAWEYTAMASVLIFIKSRLLNHNAHNLPEDNELQSTQDLSLQLQLQLQQLDAMQQVAKKLFRNTHNGIVGIDVFQKATDIQSARNDASLIPDLPTLLHTYTQVVSRHKRSALRIADDHLMTLEDVKKSLLEKLNKPHDWLYFPEICTHKATINKTIYKSYKASTFIFLLDLCREEKVRLEQDENFSIIRVKRTVPFIQ